MKNNKGFTMIELLAVVVILGILSGISIVSIQSVIAKARDKYYTSQEENMINAGRSYLEMNKQYLPKISGQEVKVNFTDLRNGKYIDEVVDYHKNKCDYASSYVRVFKYKDEYMYSANLECPQDNYYSNKQGTFGSINLNVEYKGSNSKDAKATITIDEGSKKYGIVYYSYTIYKDGIEVHSEKFEQKKNAPITTTVSLKSYVPGKIKITVTAINIYGVSKTQTFCAKKNSSDSSCTKYEDNVKPTCIIKSEDKDSNRQWEESRLITVGCTDTKDGVEGVGCTRESFSKEYSKDTYDDKIAIEDKKGNTENCSVYANVDVNPPKVVLNFYKRTSTGGRGSSVGSVTIDPVNLSVPYATITQQSDNLIVNLNVENYVSNTNNWLNQSTYPYGLYIEANYQDISKVTRIDWETNGYDIKSTGAYNYKTSVNNTEERNQSSSTPNTSSGTAKLALVGEGYRYATLTLTDLLYGRSDVEKVHKTTIILNAKIDRTAPTVPTVRLYKWNNNSSRPSSSSGLSTYTENTWTNKKVYTEALNSTDGMSGMNNYKYSTRGAVGSYSNRTASYYNVETDGISYVSYKACDIAGNCSENSDEKTIKIDTTPPKIQVTAYKRTYSGSYSSYIKSLSATSSGTLTLDWLNRDYPYGVYFIVQLTDNIEVKSLTWQYNNSGLTQYSSSVNNLITGSGYPTDLSGTSETKYFYLSEAGYRKARISLGDIAGNSAIVDIVAPMDRDNPTCDIRNQGSSDDWAQSRRITVSCNDSMSGCSYYYDYNYSSVKTKTYTVSDVAGNSITCGANIYVDSEGPECNGTSGQPSANDWTNQNRTITQYCRDSGGSGCYQSSFEKTFYSSAYTGSIYIYDNAGNGKYCDVNVYVDKEEPTIVLNTSPRGKICSGEAGVYAQYSVKDSYSGIVKINDWWGTDYWGEENPFEWTKYGIKRLDTSSSYSTWTYQETKWSAACKGSTSTGAPKEDTSYRVKIYAKDKAGNEAKYISTSTAKISKSY